MKKVDLTKLGSSTEIRILDEDILDYLRDIGADVDGYDVGDTLWVDDIDLEEIPYEFSTSFETTGHYDYDEYLFEDLLMDYLPETDANTWLVVAKGCRWNGANGYMITDNPVKTILRDYDTTAYVEDSTDDVLTITEHSHDVPMGSTTYIVGLNGDEVDMVNEMLDEELYDSINSFIEDKLSK